MGQNEKTRKRVGKREKAAKAAFIYPNANVTHSTSDKQICKHLSSEFVSVRRKVLSNGSIAPSAILSKQSEMESNSIIKLRHINSTTTSSIHCFVRTSRSLFGLVLMSFFSSTVFRVQKQRRLCVVS